MVPAKTLRAGIRSAVYGKCFRPLPRSRTQDESTIDAAKTKKAARLFAPGRLLNPFGKFFRRCQLDLKFRTLYELTRRSSG